MENAHSYASITGDDNPIHFDTKYARDSRFGGAIAHGMILGGFISGVIGTELPGFGCLYEKQSLKFLRPVYYGDEICTVVTVQEIFDTKNRVILKTECFNQEGVVVLTGEATVLPQRSENNEDF